MTNLVLIPANGPRGFWVRNLTTGKLIVNVVNGKVRTFSSRAKATAYIAQNS